MTDLTPAQAQKPEDSLKHSSTTCVKVIMNDITFSCPVHAQHIACDESGQGERLNCPTLVIRFVRQLLCSTLAVVGLAAQTSVAQNSAGTPWNLGAAFGIGDFCGPVCWPEPGGPSRGSAIGSDGQGNLYVLGTFSGIADFDPGPGTFYLPGPEVSTRGSEMFIAKYSPAGELIWAKNVPSFQPVDMAVDTSGNLFVTGDHGGSIFVEKRGPAGNVLWQKTTSGFGFGESSAIALDAQGNLLLCGSFAGLLEFTTGTGTYVLESSKTSDGSYYLLNSFACKLDSTGNLVWGVHVSGFVQNEATSISSSPDGSVYVTGLFQGAVDMDPGVAEYTLIAIDSAIAGYGSSFLWKLTSEGTLAWAKKLPASGSGFYKSCYAEACITDSNGNLLVTGTYGGDVEFGVPGEMPLSDEHYPFHEPFIAKYDPSGKVLWAKNFYAPWDGTDCDAWAISLDSKDNIYVTGSFSKTLDFDPSFDAFYLGSRGARDIFVAGLSSNGDFIGAESFGSPNADVGYAIAVGADDSILITGQFIGRTDFDPGTNIFNVSIPGIGGAAAFVLKLKQPTLPAALAVSPSQADFGPVRIGTRLDKRFIVSNAGGMPLAGSVTTSPPFSVGWRYSYTLFSGQTKEVTISYSPLTVGTNVGVVFFSGAQTVTVPVMGVATNPPLPTILSNGWSLISESLPPANGIVEPGETSTVTLSLKCVGSDANNLIARLLPSGGILLPSGPQTYGIVTAGGPGVARSFTFTAGIPCGSLTATLALEDGTNDLGIVQFTIPMALTFNTCSTFTQNVPITLPDCGAGTPYPSTNVVAGMDGSISKITVTLSNLWHKWTHLSQLLLVGPENKTVLLMDNSGGFEATGPTITFDDAASLSVSDISFTLTNGAYRPTTYSYPSSLPAPAPAVPYGKTLSTFSGLNPNGVWKLYANEETCFSGYSGLISNGWTLTITTTSANTNCISGAARASVIAPIDTAVVEGNIGTRTVVVPVALLWSCSQPISVNYTTVDGTATLADHDYVVTNGVLTFLPGETNRSINVVINGDLEVESDEIFYVNLSNPTNAAIGLPQSIVTIADDDAAPVFPTLQITQQQGNSFSLTWPAGSQGFQVQVAENLSLPIQWFAVTNQSVLANGEFSVTLPVTTTNAFYRLIKTVGN